MSQEECDGNALISTTSSWCNSSPRFETTRQRRLILPKTAPHSEIYMGHKAQCGGWALMHLSAHFPSSQIGQKQRRFVIRDNHVLVRRAQESQLPTHRMSGLEVAGAVLAVPGLIDVIVRGGEAVYDRLETFKTVDKAIARCHSLHNVALCLKY